MRAWWLVGLIGWLAGCGDDAQTGPVARFALPTSGLPAPGAVPWPSEIYLTDADGTVADTLTDFSLFGITAAEPSAMFAGIGALDGFGQQSGVLFGVDLGEDDAVDVESLAGAYALVDLETGVPVPSTAGYDAFAKAIVIIPDAPLVMGRRYAAAITSDIRLTNGAALGATAQFRELRDGSPAGDRRLFRDAGDFVASHAGLDRTKIIAATSYKTMTDQLRLKGIRDRLANGSYGPAPTLLTTGVAAPFRVTMFGRTVHAGWTATLDEWLGTARKNASNEDLTGLPGSPEAETTGVAHDAIAAVINATYVSPMFPRPFAETADYNDGTTARDSSGNAVPADPSAQVPVMIVIPAGTAPPEGFPVMIFQHGVGGDRFVAFAVANELARAGIATITIDAHLHGMRVAGASDTTSNGKGTYTGPDGIADGSNALAALEILANMRNLLRVRDNYWQLALDITQLRRLIGNLDLTAIAAEFGGIAPRLDASRVGYWGYSMGGVAGTLVAATEPRSSIDPFILAVPGGRITTVFVDSPYFASQLGLFAALGKIPFESFDANLYSVAMQFLQALVDTTDPSNFGPAAAEHNVWFTSGHQDEAVPYVSTDSFARALGATQVTPTLRPVMGLTQGGSVLTPGASGRVVGFFEVAPGTHGHAFHRFYDLTYEYPHPRTDGGDRFPRLARKITIRQPVVGEQRAMIAFVESVWAGAPRIDVADPRFLGLIPVADFDDDGHCDDAERTAGTSPFDPTSKPATPPGCMRDLGFVAP